MSQPQFPVNPDITREDALNQIISSVAAEELALGHVLNAQGEAIQYVVGTLPGLTGGSSVEDVLAIDESVGGIIDRTVENQMMLVTKLGEAISAPIVYGVIGPTGATGLDGPFTGATGPQGAVGPQGPTGPQGLNGPIGPTGDTGPQGDTGPGGVAGPPGAMGAPAPTPPPTAVVGFAANTTGASFGLILGTVVDIPLPNAQVLSGVTVDGANVLFKVPNTALYRISYHLNTTLGILIGTRLLINGGVFTPASIPVSLGRARFEAEVEMQLAADSTIKLQLVSGLIGTAVLLGGGAGASLTIMQLD